MRMILSGFAAVLMLAVSTAAIASASPVPLMHRVPSPNKGAGPNQLFGMATVSSTDAWAVGSRQQSSSAPTKTLIEHWDGQTWTLHNPPSPPPDIQGGPVLAAVSADAPNDAWAVGWKFAGADGKTLTEHWNGSKWSIVPSPNVNQSGFLMAVTALAPNNAWAVGFWDDFNGFPNVLTEHWDGSKWTVVAAPETTNFINDLLGVVAISPTDVWAVGYGQDPEFGETDALIEHYDGTAWKMVPAPRFASLAAISARSSMDVWAVGTEFLVQTSQARGLVEHWDGHAWSVVASARPTGVHTELTGVAVLAATDAWSVGWNIKAGLGPKQAIAEHWDGAHWTLVPVTGVGPGESLLSGVGAAPGGQVWAVGSDADSTGTARTLVEANCPRCA